jgi:anti-sigma regulatory factor (Ser/Thr protein kinase)
MESHLHFLDNPYGKTIPRMPKRLNLGGIAEIPLSGGKIGAGTRMEPGFRHEALVYRDAGELLAGVVPFLEEGLEAGEPALVAVSRANTELLRAELEAAAADVRFADMEAIGRNPARIVPFWLDFVDEHDGQPVRGVSEPIWPGRSAAEIEEWRRHEALLDVAFASSGTWSLLCAYDADALAAVESSPPSDFFAGELNGRPRGTAGFEFDRHDLAEVRRRVEESADAAGVSPAQTSDLVVAASELAANSVAHGGGAGTLRVWTEGSSLIVEFQDGGTIENPLVGQVRPTITQEGGRGLWLANQLCDLVQIRSGEDGTVVRLHAARDRRA